MQKVLKVFLF